MFDRFVDSIYDWLQAHGLDPIIVLTLIFFFILIDAIRDRRSAKTAFRRGWTTIAIWTASFMVLWGTLYALGVFPKQSGAVRRPDTIQSAVPADGILRDTSYWRTGWRDSTGGSHSDAGSDTGQRTVAH